MGHTDVAADKVFNEEDWSNSEKVEGYNKSKTDAEKAAWDFVKELPGETMYTSLTYHHSYLSQINKWQNGGYNFHLFLFFKGTMLLKAFTRASH